MRTLLVFEKFHGSYNPGDVAAFDHATATGILKSGHARLATAAEAIARALNPEEFRLAMSAPVTKPAAVVTKGAPAIGNASSPASVVAKAKADEIARAKADYEAKVTGQPAPASPHDAETKPGIVPESIDPEAPPIELTPEDIIGEAEATAAEAKASEHAPTSPAPEPPKGE